MNFFYIVSIIFFFFNDTATTEIYTLSLHDALPISLLVENRAGYKSLCRLITAGAAGKAKRSEEHTSELQSHVNLVCRLLLEKKKKKKNKTKSTFDTQFYDIVTEHLYNHTTLESIHY